jgi:hypothetical protein
MSIVTCPDSMGSRPVFWNVPMKRQFGLPFSPVKLSKVNCRDVSIGAGALSSLSPQAANAAVSANKIIPLIPGLLNPSGPFFLPDDKVDNHS